MISVKGRAFAPVELENHEIFAIRNLARGEASADQQKKAFQLIVERFCAADDLSWRPEDAGGARETDFHEGRRFPGLQLRKIAFTAADRVLKPEPEGNSWPKNKPAIPTSNSSQAVTSNPPKRKRGRPPKPKP